VLQFQRYEIFPRGLLFGVPCIRSVDSIDSDEISAVGMHLSSVFSSHR